MNIFLWSKDSYYYILFKKLFKSGSTCRFHQSNGTCMFLQVGWEYFPTVLRAGLWKACVT